ncbi:phage major capsid protein, P2 family [Shewanella sp. D64]|uniref:phage major capsid protein, P2 family n=1 Tax=unclassified Shewanella TaxID=196818 RepID=UPI0022BA45E7|nr:MULTISPECIES: phage major capsid protein, P2 family [unclassified Shewanella]MEC4728838.1 phage major capsid protein, P2 family [Shewanella sp. D64]MEC4740712.1 phage major capsid protein, P2 family [Shewanella sp. E94]WBJ95329.1 phage major capsid protein, P2 family [Shewanella sp. MTB7]
MATVLFKDQDTEKKVAQLLARTQTTYSLSKQGVYFSVDAPKETKLRSAIMEENSFLKRVSMVDVLQIAGQAVTVGSDKLSTGRGVDRFAGTTPELDAYEYKLSVVDSVVYITWARLAEWANVGSQKEFEKKLWAYFTQQIGNDMLRVAWNGLHAAKITDPIKYPNGEDVNEGWHARIKRVAPAQIVGAQLDDADAEVYFDPDATRDANGVLQSDYNTLDAMASDLINNTLAPEFRDAPDLVVLVGRDLIAAAQYRLYSQADKPTEHNAAQQLDKSIAGRVAYVVPYFPGKRMVVTTLKNLAIYTQKGTRRRKLKDNDDKGRVESFLWRMEGNMVEEPTKYAAFDESIVVIGSYANRPDEPQITTGLIEKTVAVNTEITLSVVATNTSTYHWRINGQTHAVTDENRTVIEAGLAAGEYEVSVECIGPYGNAYSKAKLIITA